MERFKIGLPDEQNVVVKNTFVVDEIIPVCLSVIDGSSFRLIFRATQNSTEESILLQVALYCSDKRDTQFINNHPLNILNVKKDFERLKFYNEAVKDLSNSIYATDFYMTELDDKPYFIANGAKALDDIHATVLDLLVTRDNFIKINLFFNRLKIYDKGAESVFLSHKLHNMKFSTINRSKLDGSASDIASNLVCSHYTTGNGPETYRFNFLSARLNGRKLRCPMSVDVYNSFYSDHFVIADTIYEPVKDILYAVFEVRSDITDNYKETKILRFNKEFYNRTNLVDISRIYEDLKDKEK